MEIDDDWKKKFQTVAELASNRNCLAIGECGFDARSQATEDQQKEVFQEHLVLAKELGKPIIVHCVRRYDWLLAFAPADLLQMVIHGFNKNEQLGKELLRKGFGLSLGRALLENKSVQKLLVENELSGIFFETDDHPMPVEAIYRHAAKLLNKDLFKVQQQIQHNLNNLWNEAEMAGA